MTVLVVGASGNVGSRVLEGLKEKGADVLAARHSAPPADPSARKFDYDDPQTWAPALAGVDKVFMIPKSGDPYPDKTLIPFIAQAKASGVKRVVFLTAMALDKDWRVLKTAEDALIASGMDYVILRPNWMMQNFLAPAMCKALAGGTVAQACGQSVVSHVDTRDCGDVAVVGLLEDRLLGREITLTGPRALSWPQTCEILSQAAGHAIRYVDVPEADFRNGLLGVGVQPYRVEQMQQMYRALRSGLHAEVDPAISDILGRPARTLEDFAAEYGHLWKA